MNERKLIDAVETAEYRRKETKAGIRQQQNARKEPRWRWRYRGIMRHSAILGVTAEHLRLVLDKKRVSPKLTQRYHALIAQEASAAAISEKKTQTKGSHQ